MNDNISAFNTMEYNTKIKQTLPYYDEFYKQVIELVKTFHSGAVRWLDVGCGTGKMGSVAFENVALEKFVFSDCSEKMIKIVKERFDFENTEFVVCDAKELDYVNEFDVITAIQVNHYMNETSRKAALMKYYAALKNNGLFISFENFAPFTDLGKSIYLERWKRYQLEQGKTVSEIQILLYRSILLEDSLGVSRKSFIYNAKSVFFSSYHCLCLTGYRIALVSAVDADKLPVKVMYAIEKTAK